MGFPRGVIQRVLQGYIIVGCAVLVQLQCVLGSKLSQGIEGAIRFSQVLTDDVVLFAFLVVTSSIHFAAEREATINQLIKSEAMVLVWSATSEDEILLVK